VVVGVSVGWGIFLMAANPSYVFNRFSCISWWKNPLVPGVLLLISATVSMAIVPVFVTDITGETVNTLQIAQGVWKGWIVMPLIFFYMLWLIPKDSAWKERSSLALCLSAGVLSGFALYQMVTGDFLTADGRASGPFESANYLALYVGPVFVLATLHGVRFWSGKSRSKAVGWLAMALMVGVALWGTQSYAAFMAVAAGFSFYVLTSGYFSLRVKMIGVLGVLLIGFLMFLTQWNTLKFQQFLDFEGRTSSSIRLEVYTVAITLLKEHPLAGIGLGQFPIQYRLNAVRILEHFPYEWVMIHPHNLYIAWWLNVGVFGFVAMGWWVGLFFGPHEKAVPQRFNRLRRWIPTFVQKWFASQVHADPYVFLLRAVMVTILVHGLFDMPFFKNDLAYLWWWVVAVGL
jgi:O-antigen ligase